MCNQNSHFSSITHNIIPKRPVIWPNTMNVRDTGILRKKCREPANFDDLLIIGYQSKIFHDDEKALFIDQGRHLIGWMGSDSLKIDRLIRPSNIVANYRHLKLLHCPLNHKHIDDLGTGFDRTKTQYGRNARVWSFLGSCFLVCVSGSLTITFKQLLPAWVRIV